MVQMEAERAILMEIIHGKLLVTSGALAVQCALAYWQEGMWHSLFLQASGEAYLGQAAGITVVFALADGAPGTFRYTLHVTADFPTRMQFACEPVQVTEPFHILPGVLFGDNNLAHTGPTHFPHLTTAYPKEPACASYWECRADRASHPVSVLAFSGGIAAVSIAPYTARAGDDVRETSWVCNGLFAQLAHADMPLACGATVGYRNTPLTFVNKDTWDDPTQDHLYNGTVQGMLFLLPAADRRGVHAVIRHLYQDIHEAPTATLSVEEAIPALVDVLVYDSWQPDYAHFADLMAAKSFCEAWAPIPRTALSPDVHPWTLLPWRDTPEIGWTGGANLGYPLLVAADHIGHAVGHERAVAVLQYVADAYNPASGLLWDISSPARAATADGWWHVYLRERGHCAYTNGTAVSYLLNAYRYLHQTGQEAPACWRETALAVLRTICSLQLPDGNLGVVYATDRPAILDADGFAGVWFVPALATAYELTNDERFRDAAVRGLRYYYQCIMQLNCWNTPMDTWKAVDEEGALGFIRGAAALHRLTKQTEFLTMLRDGVEYEFLWRYAYRTRPEAPPLKNTGWNVCGGSITSVSNPHVHPMGLIITPELHYLAEQTGDAYILARCEDGLRWALQCLELFPSVAGYGRLGVMTERFCPSDGLLIERYADGTPASLWFTYNAWAAASVLEGLTLSTPLAPEASPLRASSNLLPL